MKKVKEIIARITAPAALIVALALFSVTLVSSATAQEKAPGQQRGRSAVSDSARIQQVDKRFFCQQKINDLSIVQKGAGRYTFYFRTPCSTPVTIEFSETPPVSLNPPRFKKMPYDPNKPLVPVITTGLIGDRTEHDLTANLGADKRVDYYLITVEDGAGNKIYHTGSLALDSVRDFRVRARRPLP
ncbi:MAG: hypothetical protein HY231_06395 [Acidobacteria bacterium]|nr:hypothetical protein [Acidobacteriota bacterium]